jgi:hypothetical protein
MANPGIAEVSATKEGQESPLATILNDLNSLVGNTAGISTRSTNVAYKLEYQLTQNSHGEDPKAENCADTSSIKGALEVLARNIAEIDANVNRIESLVD